MRNLLGTTAAVALLVLGVGSANAASTTIGYGNITNNTSYNGSQLSTEISEGTGNAVLFKFLNAVGLQSSITDIYFSDHFGGPAGSALFDTNVTQANITDSGAGVDFSWGASPAQLPGNNNASPPFNGTLALAADTNPPVGPNGVNSASEWLTISLNLLTGKTFSDVLTSLSSGTLRLGLHVQQIGSGSDSFVNNPPSAVPVPAALPLFGTALVGIAALRFRRKRSS